ncbi:protein kinase domain-containing protein [Hyalangium gracile]|uniref:protein kinase domain-containing protein n=1 Tax=Hyalangium gracile TaxID=394092 RepID=UPI001CCB64FD|nr:serine/threonine-protein kinase [Hyalangium gracile]
MQLSKSYQLIRKLASGGMAEVFLARTEGPRGFSKTLVLKRILPHLAEDEQFVEMFLAEARLVAQLNHPNVVHIFDFGEFEGSYCIAMEYIDGPNLRVLARQARSAGVKLAPALCAKIVSYACEGLAYAHDLVDPQTGRHLGLVHRDVSTDNILVSRVGTVKVVDFGVAKVIGQGHGTRAGIIKGKLPYMPPEQLRGRPLDRRVDVYALGVVLYELLTNKRPFDVTGEAALMSAILDTPAKPLRERSPGIPAELARITERCLAKEREERYASCRHLRADLERFILGMGEPVGTDEIASLIARVMPPDGGAAPVGSTSDIRAPPPLLRAVPPSRAGPRPAKPPVLLPVMTPRKVDTGEVELPASQLGSALERSRLQEEASASASLELGVAATVPREAQKSSQRRAGLVAMSLGLLTVLVAVSAFLMLRQTPSLPASAQPPALAVAPPAPEPAAPQAPVVAPEPPRVEVKEPPRQEATVDVPSSEVTVSVSARAPPPTEATERKKRSPPVERGADRLATAVETAASAPPEVREPVEQKPQLASVVFESSPPAQIRVNGEFKKHGSVAMSQLAPGPVQVEVYDSVKGFSKRQSFVLAPGDNGVLRVSVEQGTLELRIRPSAAVYLDGRYKGLASSEPIPVYEGTHELKLENKDLGKVVIQTITIEPGKTLLFEYDLEKES